MAKATGYCFTCGNKIPEVPSYVGTPVVGSGFSGTLAKNHFHCSQECMAEAREANSGGEPFPPPMPW